MKKLIIKILKTLMPFLLFLTLWQVASSINVLNAQFLPSPIAIVKEFYLLLINNGLIFDILQSLKRVLVGFTIATTAGITLGIVLGNYKFLSQMLKPLIEIFRPVPPIAWVPLAILWFGLGDFPAFFLVSLGSFFPIFSNTFLGATSIEASYKNAAKNFGVGEWQYIVEILVPSALPYIFAGLKIGLGVSWMTVIVAELVGAQSGLGYMIQVSRITLETPAVIVGMVVIGIIGFGMNQFMSWFEHKLIPWGKSI